MLRRSWQKQASEWPGGNERLAPGAQMVCSVGRSRPAERRPAASASRDLDLTFSSSLSGAGLSRSQPRRRRYQTIACARASRTGTLCERGQGRNTERPFTNDDALDERTDGRGQGLRRLGPVGRDGDRCAMSDSAVEHSTRQITRRSKAQNCSRPVRISLAQETREQRTAVNDWAAVMS